MWACVCICVSLKVHIGMCVYPYRYVCVCSYEQVWAHVCVLEGMCSVGVFECRYICTVVCAGLCPDRCGRYVERCVCVHCSWVGLHSSGLQQTALLYSYLSEAQRGAEKSKPEEWSTLMSFWEPAAALSMPLNVISVLTRWGGGGAGTRDVRTPTLPIQKPPFTQHRILPHQPGFQEPCFLLLLDLLRLLILNHSLVPADSGCSGYLK